MILRPSDICLRPIRTPHSDNISAGITSARISSASLRWAADTSANGARCNYRVSMTSLPVIRNAKSERDEDLTGFFWSQV